MDTEALDILIILQKDKGLRRKIKSYTRCNQDVDDVFGDVILKFTTRPHLNFNNKRSYIISALFNTAKKSRLGNYNKKRSDDTLIFNVMGNDTFATMFNFFEKEETYRKLDEALQTLTDKQKDSIKDLLDFDSKYLHYYKQHFEGKNVHTLRKTRRLAIFKLKSCFEVITKDVLDKYLSIYNDHSNGKIKNIKRYLKDNNIHYGTYYSNIRHLIPKNKKIDKFVLTDKQQKALDIFDHIKVNKLIAKNYVKTIGLNYESYKNRLRYARQKMEAIGNKHVLSNTKEIT